RRILRAMTMQHKRLHSRRPGRSAAIGKSRSAAIGKSRRAALAMPFAILVAAFSLAPLSAAAAVTATDMQIAARVLGFTTTPITGTVKLGIVYDPANATSAADETALVGILGSGLTVGAVTLVPVPVPIASLSSASADVLFLTSGLGTAAGPVGSAAAAKKILCMTTDTAANAAGDCAVAVQSDPSVKITVNKAAAAASGVSFATAFTMMITEI
ncbi:MAG: hypothetical protein POH28_12580, partial [Acidocella sp.]|nr:hypothetical protein [Acidocella sp.]